MFLRFSREKKIAITLTPNPREEVMKKKLWILSFIMAIMFMMAGLNLASASVITLTDLNSTVKIDSTAGAGMYGWTVNNGDVGLIKQWFWVKVNGGTVQALEDFDSNPVESGGGNNTDNVEFAYRTGNAEMSAKYILTGNLPGSPTAEITEIITITNWDEAATLSFTLYEYNNFNLASTPLDDLAKLTGNTVYQWEGMNISEVGAGSPVGFVIGDADDVLDAISGSNVLGSIAGVFPTVASQQGDYFGLTGVDLAWSFQWDFVLSPETSVSFSKDKNIVTPVPTTLLLFGSGLFSLIGVGIRRRKS